MARARLEARAILLAFGVRETPRSARLIGGDRPWGVITTGALQQFVYLQKIRPFRRAVIVGSELVAFSALLTLRHGGIATAAMIEEGPRITARRPADCSGAPCPRRAGADLDPPPRHPRHRQGGSRRGRARRKARTHRLRRRRLHRPLPARDRHSRHEPYRARSRHRRARHRSILAQQRSAGLRRRQSAASRGDRRRVPGPRAAPPPRRSPRIWRAACPQPAPAIAVTAKAPLRYVYPQRLVTPLAGLSPLLLKARAEPRGARAAAAAGRWTRALEPAR